jgi:AcrR family transcriptional regulator
MSNPSSKRPGGRSARVKTAVFDAVETLLAENGGEFPSMAEIAERAGVNTTSLYRRWGDARNLLVDVAIERLMRDRPVPDLGSVREDLVTWAVSVAKSICSPEGLSLFRIVASNLQATQGKEGERDIMKTPVGPRIAELKAVLERGRQRGERVPDVQEVIEIVLAPIYLHALFRGAIEDPEGVSRLVDRALLLAAARAGDRSAA